MANDQNLKGHGFNEITAKRQREIASAGGIASAKARKERKIFEEAILKRLKATDMDEIVANLIKRAKDNSKDLETLRDTIGEKPTSKTEADITTDGESIKGITVEFKNLKKK